MTPAALGRIIPFTMFRCEAVWKYVFIGIVGITLSATLVSSQIRVGAQVGDFWALYDASRHAYETGRIDDPDSLGYYPPSGRPLMMLLAPLPARVGGFIWWSAAAGLQLLCLYVLIRHLMPGPVSDPWRLATFTYFALLPWIVADLTGGNISTLMLASIVLSFYFYRRGRTLPAAAILGAGIAVKIFPVFMVLFYGIKRRWRMAGMAAGATVVIGVLPGVLLFGAGEFAESWRVWSERAKIRSPRYMIVDGPGISYINQSVANVLRHTLSPVNAGHRSDNFLVNVADLPRPVILVIWYVVMSAAGLAWVWMLWPRKTDSPGVEAAQLGLVGIAVLWFSPHVMSYYLTVLMPAVALLMWAGSEAEYNGLAGLRGAMAAPVILYFLGDLSVASRYARAYGSYLLIMVVLAVAVGITIRRMRPNGLRKAT